MNEIIAKDLYGVKRCYGLNPNRHRAIIDCVRACRQYMVTRPDIEALYLFDGETDQPIRSSAGKQWHVVRGDS